MNLILEIHLTIKIRQTINRIETFGNKFQKIGLLKAKINLSMIEINEIIIGIITSILIKIEIKTEVLKLREILIITVFLLMITFKEIIETISNPKIILKEIEFNFKIIEIRLEINSLITEIFKIKIEFKIKEEFNKIKICNK